MPRLFAIDLDAVDVGDTININDDYLLQVVAKIKNPKSPGYTIKVKTTCSAPS